MAKVANWMVRTMPLAVMLMTLSLFSWVLLLGYWSLDRELPSKVLSYNSIYASPGMYFRIDGRVQRSLHRECSVEGSYVFFDAQNARHHLKDFSLSAAMIAENERKTPGKFAVPLQMPESAAYGTGELLVSTEGACNSLQKIFPIRGLNRYKVEVVP